MSSIDLVDCCQSISLIEPRGIPGAPNDPYPLSIPKPNPSGPLDQLLWSRPASGDGAHARRPLRLARSSLTAGGRSGRQNSALGGSGLGRRGGREQLLLPLGQRLVAADRARLRLLVATALAGPRDQA